MSVVLGGVFFNGFLLPISDERNTVTYHQWGLCSFRMTQDCFGDGVLWPNSRGMGGQLSGSITNDATSCSGSFELCPNFEDGGGAQIKKIIGTTLDSNGNPLGSCVVMGYVTSTELFIGQTTSDPGGYYELPTPFSGQQHYIVVYQPGDPDRAGASVNTLIPV